MCHIESTDENIFSYFRFYVYKPQVELDHYLKMLLSFTDQSYLYMRYVKEKHLFLCTLSLFLFVIVVVLLLFIIKTIGTMTGHHWLSQIFVLLINWKIFGIS